jgi:SET domain-containing protein
MVTLHTLPPKPPAESSSPRQARSASRRDVPLRVGTSAIEGQGVYAVEAIVAREKIGEIRGESVSQREAFARARVAREQSGHVFMIAVSDKRAIDATASTDPLRFANHACEPNMVLKIQQGRAEFYAMRDIAAGEELTADYGATHHAGKLACRCGAARCRGWL